MSNKGTIFTPIQVARLWKYQFGPWRGPFEEITDENAHLPPQMHPFTCGNRSDHPTIAGDEGVLVPTTRGWICVICDYTQDWAHGFMSKAEGDAAEPELASTERPKGTPPQPVAEPDAPKQEKT